MRSSRVLPRASACEEGPFAEVGVVNPAIDIVKSSEDQSSDGLVLFTITVTNIGDVTLRQTVVEDAMFPGCAKDAAAVRLLGSNQGGAVGWLFKPGETFSYTCGDEVAESGTNEAIARGWYEGVEFNDTDTADYTIN